MKNQIENALEKLLGLPLWSIGRAGGLTWFAFGTERRNVFLRNGAKKIVSEYALHIQCSWRIRYKNTIVVASGDRFYPRGANPFTDMENFEWDKQGANQMDERASNLLSQYVDHPLTPNNIEVDDIGGFCINFGQEYFFDVFPDNSIGIEYWRFFQPDSEDVHFVLTKNGIEYE